MKLSKAFCLCWAVCIVAMALGSPTKKLVAQDPTSNNPQESAHDPDSDANEVRWSSLNPRFSRLWAPWTYAGAAGYPKFNWGGRHVR